MHACIHTSLISDSIYAFNGLILFQVFPMILYIYITVRMYPDTELPFHILHNEFVLLDMQNYMNTESTKNFK